MNPGSTKTQDYTQNSLSLDLVPIFKLCLRIWNLTYCAPFEQFVPSVRFSYNMMEVSGLILGVIGLYSPYNFYTMKLWSPLTKAKPSNNYVRTLWCIPNGKNFC